jgi:hypothetical protein
MKTFGAGLELLDFDAASAGEEVRRFVGCLDRSLVGAEGSAERCRD